MAGRWGADAGLLTYTAYTSESFSGGTLADLSGRTTDAALGGSGLAWVKGNAAAKVLGISAGSQLASGASNGSNNQYGLNVGHGDMFVFMTVNSVQTANQSLSLFARSDATLSAENNYRVRASVNGSVLDIQKVIAGTGTVITTGSYTWTNGDVIGIRCSGSSISLVKNGIVLETVTDTQWANTRGYCGIRATGTVVCGGDDFVVRSR